MAGIQVLDRAFLILDIIAREPDKPHFVNEIAPELGINNTTCTNIITSLVSNGYLESLSKRRGYILGPAPYVLTQKGQYKKVLIDVAYPYLKRLSAKINETSLLSIIKHTTRSTLCYVEKDSPIQIRSEYLKQPCPYEVATGRLLISFQNKQAIERVVKELDYPGERWDGIDNKEKLQAACREIQDNGYCIKINNDNILVSIAFPVFCGTNIEASLGLFLLKSEFTGSHRELLLKEMEITSRSISEELSEFMKLDDPQSWRLKYKNK